MANKNTKVKQRNTVSRPNGDGVISQNPRRNTQMRVLKNTGADGKLFSVTVHEPIDENRPMHFKNIGYIHEAKEYKQPLKFRAGPYAPK